MGVFFSHLSFWWLLIGLFLILARMPTPGMRMIDKKKYFEVKRELDEKLASEQCRGFLGRTLLYFGRYFFIFHYYRNDLIFLWVVSGAALLKLISVWLEKTG